MSTQVDDVAALLGGPPPRRVSSQLARAVLGSPWSGLLSGGLLLTLAGGLLAALLFPRGLLDDRSLDRAATRVAGRVTAVERTAVAEERVQRHARGAVARVRFTFTEAGREWSGESYCTCRPGAGDDPCAGGGKGAIGGVEHRPDRPQTSRLAGCRSSLLGPWTASTLALPLLGCGLVVLALARRWLRLRLLSQGVPASGRVVDVRMTGVAVGSRHLHRVLVALDVGEGATAQAVVEAWGEDAEAAERHRDAGTAVLVLYDRRDPRRALVPSWRR